MNICTTNRYIFVCFIFFFSCEDPKTEETYSSMEIMLVSDFASSESCSSCHPDQYSQWKRSKHFTTSHDPKYYYDWNEEQIKRPHTGTQFCAQCHNPIAYVTGTDLGEYDSPDIFLMNESVPDVLKEGINCTFCHSMVQSSQSIFSSDNPNGLPASAEYYLNPDSLMFYGSIENPIDNSYHNSSYNPLYSSAESCLPCHNHFVRGMEIETTFSEWNENSFVAMTGALPCQDCHMKPYEGKAALGGPDRIVHNHNFAGVNIDLTQPINPNDLQYQDVESLLRTSVNMYFDSDHDGLYIENDTLYIPVIIDNLTAHNIPSGNAFVREVWVELVVFNASNEIVFSSGSIESNIEDLDQSDVNLWTFDVRLFDANGDRTFNASDAYSYTSSALLTLQSGRKKLYKVELDGNGSYRVVATLRFRPYKPSLLSSHPEMLENLPVFDMEEIEKTVSR